MHFDYGRLSEETANSVLRQIQDYETELWNMEFSPAVQRVLEDLRFKEIEVHWIYDDNHKHLKVSEPEKVIKRLHKLIDKEVDRRFDALLQTIKTAKPPKN